MQEAEFFTDWFGFDVKPATAGLYQVSVTNGVVAWAFWSGTAWHTPSKIRRAAGVSIAMDNTPFSLSWRGMTKQAAIAAKEAMAVHKSNEGERDPFRPYGEISAQIYDCIRAEARLRKSRPGLTWIQAELDAVYKHASALFPAYGILPPTREQVVKAEIYARGSADYSSKWAISLVNDCSSPEQRLQ